jgi:hypothetical protein
MIKRIFSAIKNRLPVYQLNRELQHELRIWKKGLYAPGHYHSPITVSESNPEVTGINYDQEIPGVDLNDDGQRLLLEKLVLYYKADTFPSLKQRDFRYFSQNDYFSYSDGIFLQVLIRHFKPKRIIEVGSGFSSALMLDVNEKFMEGSIDLTFIDPYPEQRLNTLLGLNERCTILKAFVQQVSPDIFRKLSAGDILFIDSSHVSKFESDLNYILFSVLPVLKPGVIIHFHDVFFPFEYPVEWRFQGRSWNECYLLRAFLQYNHSFEILLFTSFLEGKHRTWFEKNMPQCLIRHENVELDGKLQLMNTTGQSIYLQKR